MDLQGYPLTGPLKRLLHEVSGQGRLHRLNEAARLGNDYVRRRHDPRVIAATWRAVIESRNEPAGHPQPWLEPRRYRWTNSIL